MVTNIYKNGLPWNCQELTNSIEEEIIRISIDMATVILIDGGQGQGKTTLATHIGDKVNMMNGFPVLDLTIRNHRQIGLGGTDFVSKFNKCKRDKLPVIIYDEAGDYSKASTMSWFNYQLSKLFQKIRSARMIVIMCLPNFNILDNRLFDDEIIRGAIHCYGRQITINYGNFSAYDIDKLSWIRHWYNKLPSARRFACYDMVNPLFRGHFKDLPLKREKQLEILSNYGKDRERIEAEVNMRGLLNIRDLAKEVNRSDIWVRKHLAQHNIKAEEQLNRKNYYTKSALKRLERDLETR